WRKWQARFFKDVLSNYLRCKPRPGLVKVSWKGPAGNVVAWREYYLLSKQELVSLVSACFSVLFIATSGGPGGKDNHFIIGRVKS
nr:hypothetical protein [Candidatus Sigynarchaeota archaeon]